MNTIRPRLVGGKANEQKLLTFVNPILGGRHS
jgi:hypothetical protein